MKKFTVINSGTNDRTVFETEATTVADLLNEFDARGIDYEGKTIFEGVSHNEFSPSRPDAILPHDLPWKDATTSNLVFMLTAEKKKISSGADRMAIYDLIRSTKGAKEAIAERFGRNFTQVGTEELGAFMAEFTSHENHNPENKEHEVECNTEIPCEHCVMPAILRLLFFLDANGAIDLDCLVDNIHRYQNGELDRAPENKEPEDNLPEEFTAEDLEAMRHNM